MRAKLGLGTVQFGMPYGISNTRGQVPEREVAEILALAADTGVEVLDTAFGYGESEAVLGRQLWGGHRFRIVTKTSHIAGEAITAKDVRQVEDNFKRSLERLKASCIDTLLVHRAEELIRPGGSALAHWLIETKDAGLAAKIGFSCYDPDELDAALAVLEPDVVQVPISVVDRRFIAPGVCAKLRRRNTEIHARSVFLQGLLLMEDARLPAYFAPFRSVLHVRRSRSPSRGATRTSTLRYSASQASLSSARTSRSRLPWKRNSTSRVSNAMTRRSSIPRCGR
jgi:aryl-alcohol dehydrogenase-like predicted oxidoreductase